MAGIQTFEVEESIENDSDLYGDDNNDSFSPNSTPQPLSRPKSPMPQETQDSSHNSQNTQKTQKTQNSQKNKKDATTKKTLHQKQKQLIEESRVLTPVKELNQQEEVNKSTQKKEIPTKKVITVDINEVSNRLYRNDKKSRSPKKQNQSQLKSNNNQQNSGQNQQNHQISIQKHQNHQNSWQHQSHHRSSNTNLGSPGKLDEDMRFNSSSQKKISYKDFQSKCLKRMEERAQMAEQRITMKSKEREQQKASEIKDKPSILDYPLKKTKYLGNFMNRMEQDQSERLQKRRQRREQHEKDMSVNRSVRHSQKRSNIVSPNQHNKENNPHVLTRNSNFDKEKTRSRSRIQKIQDKEDESRATYTPQISPLSKRKIRKYDDLVDWQKTKEERLAQRIRRNQEVEEKLAIQRKKKNSNSGQKTIVYKPIKERKDKSAQRYKNATSKYLDVFKGVDNIREECLKDSFFKNGSDDGLQDTLEMVKYKPQEPLYKTNEKSQNSRNTSKSRYNSNHGSSSQQQRADDITFGLNATVNTKKNEESTSNIPNLLFDSQEDIYNQFKEKQKLREQQPQVQVIKDEDGHLIRPTRSSLKRQEYIKNQLRESQENYRSNRSKDVASRSGSRSKSHSYSPEKKQRKFKLQVKGKGCKTLVYQGNLVEKSKNYPKKLQKHESKFESRHESKYDSRKDSKSGSRHESRNESRSKTSNNQYFKQNYGSKESTVLKFENPETKKHEAKLLEEIGNKVKGMKEDFGPSIDIADLLMKLDKVQKDLMKD